MADATLTPVDGDPFAGGYYLTPVQGNPFSTAYASSPMRRVAPAAQPAIGQPGAAPLDDFQPANALAAAPQPTFPWLAGVAGDPSRSMAVRAPAAIGSVLADRAAGLVSSAWGAATLPGDVATGKVDPNSSEAVNRSTDLAGWLTMPAAGAKGNPNVLSGMSGAFEVDPHTLTFRESMQNNTRGVAESFPEGEGYEPITTINDGGNLKILDGHNRASVAMERGDNIPAVSLSQEEYDGLKNRGYDDSEISYATLSAAGEDEAASSTARQFPGAGIAERGTEAQYVLEDMREAAKHIRLTPVQGNPFEIRAKPKSEDTYGTEDADLW